MTEHSLISKSVNQIFSSWSYLPLPSFSIHSSRQLTWCYHHHHFHQAALFADRLLPSTPSTSMLWLDSDKKLVDTSFYTKELFILLLEDSFCVRTLIQLPLSALSQYCISPPIPTQDPTHPPLLLSHPLFLAHHPAC